MTSTTGHGAATAALHDTGRRLRADAARNRERILAAAQKLISEHGEGVSMDDIAALAGVGMGTVYRRFPTKEALIEQLVADVRSRLLQAADEALQAPEGLGLELFLRSCGRYFATSAGCVAALWHQSAVRSPPVSAAVTQRIGELLDRARAHHRVAPEIGTHDVIVLLRAIHALNTMVDPGPVAWERHLDIHLAGLAVGAPTR